jgi:glutamyl-tRNA synthetase
MLRFAPSPTGDMHIGNLRVALFNYILSVQTNEPLIIRIEDTDKERNIEGKDQEIIGLLDLFGIKYRDVLYQSDNLKYHRAMALQLINEKIAFNCFCCENTLEAKREEAKANRKPYRYDDACLSLTPEETIDNEAPFTVRLRKPSVDVEFTDVIKVKMTFKPSDIDSFIILRADKSPTYNFACAIDDMIADISMVIRGEDHVSNTPKQIAVRAALNYTKEIKYAHLPVILNDSGKKMSKRDDASSVKWLLEEGFLPSAIINYLILIGNKPPVEIFTLKEALEWFDLSKISKAPAKFDIDKLRFINKKHLEKLDDVELSRYVGFADKDIGQLAKIYLDEVSTTKELREKIAAIFAEKTIPQEFEEAAATMKETLQKAPFFEEFNDFKSYIMKESGLKGKNFFKPLRLLLSGAEHGPELEVMYPFIKNYMAEIVK